MAATTAGGARALRCACKDRLSKRSGFDLRSFLEVLEAEGRADAHLDGRAAIGCLRVGWLHLSLEGFVVGPFCNRGLNDLAIARSACH